MLNMLKERKKWIAFFLMVVFLFTAIPFTNVYASTNETSEVTFTLLGDSIHKSNVDGEVHTLAYSNLETWVAKKSYKIGTNTTVKDILDQVLKENNMTDDNPSGNYVKSITKDGVTLGEFTNGTYSGWMYTLNGDHSSLGVSEQKLSSGDDIVFHYTDFYPRESDPSTKGSQSLTATATKTELMIGETASITAKGVGEISYTSSDESILTVDANGLVTARGIGTAKITVSASGNKDYNSANKSLRFTINRVTNAITVNPSFTKNASASKEQTFSLGAKAAGGTLSYQSNNSKITVDDNGKVTIAKNYAGTATITITAGDNNYEEVTKSVTVTVNQIAGQVKVSNASVTKTAKTSAQTFTIQATRSGSGKLTYSSNNKSVTVSNTGKVTISKNFVGKATITVKAAAAGAYKAANTKVTVTVNLTGTKLSTLINAKSQKMTVKWAKNANVAGYQIQYSTDKNFKKNVKSVSVSKAGTTSKTISGLKKGSKYYVRIRTNIGTKYSAWSTSKNVTIKK